MSKILYVKGIAELCEAFRRIATAVKTSPGDHLPG